LIVKWCRGVVVVCIIVYITPAHCINYKRISQIVKGENSYFFEWSI
jgi:hypothetical protein